MPSLCNDLTSFVCPKRKLLQPTYCQNTASAATAHGAFPKRFIVPNLYAIFTTKKSVSLVKF